MNFQTTTTFLQSPSSSHYILQHKKKLTISLPIVNSNELNHKDGKKKIACSHHLLLNPTTIEEGDDIAAVTFSQQNHQKRRKLPFFGSKAIEEGDGSCRLFPLHYNRTIEENDNSLL
jgi:hypothetical protein